MLESVLRAVRPPVVFQANTLPFWQDEHISKQMLAAHLDPDTDGASRRPAFIGRSCAWIGSVFPKANFPRLLDLGCGPGLYARRLAADGYAVSGRDLSPRSIGYARRQAEKAGLCIDYRVQNYLEMDEREQYDAAVMIYCDFGALSPQNRAALLANTWAALRPGGRLLLDVFTTSRLSSLREVQRWQAFPSGGFWSAEPHLALFLGRKYPGGVILDQTTIIVGETLRTYYLWDQHFDVAGLAAEARAAGFAVAGLYDDVAGAPYTGAAETMAVILEKGSTGGRQ